MRHILETQHMARQRGMATFAVTTTLVLVISLIVVGFSLVSRRSQQQGLDRQLGQQATLAAESAANMAAISIQKQIAGGLTPEEKTDCQNNKANYPQMQLEDTAADVRVTCILVTKDPKTLEYGNVSEGAPTIVPLTSADNNLSAITIKWTGGDGNPNPPLCGSNGYRRPSSWQCGFGIIRVDIAPPSTGVLNQYAKTAFLYPYTAGGQSAEVAYADMNNVWSDAICTKDGCMKTITGLTPGQTYYMSLRSLYKTSNVTISGTTSTGTTARFSGQTVVDVTARSVDVAKRISVRVPLDERPAAAPGFAIESADTICKRYATAPQLYIDDTGGPGCSAY